MKNRAISAFSAAFVAVSLISGCDLFGGKDACEDPNCLESDAIFVKYRSAADSSVNLIYSGQFSHDDLSIVPILLDKNGDSPTIFRIIDTTGKANNITILVNENLRGIAFQLGNLAPDTILLTTGLAPPVECCPDPRVTISQLLANGQFIPSVGVVVNVDFFK